MKVKDIKGIKIGQYLTVNGLEAILLVVVIFIQI